MATLTSPADLTTLSIIDRWKETVAETLADIEGWQGHSVARIWPTMPASLFSDTQYIVSELASRFPKIDPQPISDVYRVAATWYGQRRLKETAAALQPLFDQAVLAVNVLQQSIVDQRTGEATEKKFPSQQSHIALTPEEKTILETLRAEHPMTVVQADFAVGALNTTRKYLASLMAKQLVCQPNGSKKGYGLTEKGMLFMRPTR
jgi:hypothetical protein